MANDKSEQSGAPAATGKPAATPYPELFGNVRITGDLLTADATRPWFAGVPGDKPHHQYVIWLGCQMLRTAHLAQTLDDVMKHFSVDQVMLGGPSNCCGTVHHGRGDVAIGESMTRQTVSKFDAFTPEKLLYWCPSCDNHLRIKGEEFATETTRNRISVIEFLSRAASKEKFVADVPLRVAVHLHHGFVEQDKDTAGIKHLLSMIPGLELIDMPQLEDIGRHCSDGTLKKYGKEKFLTELGDWITEAKRRGAERVISVYHSCHRQLVIAQLGKRVEDRVGVENYLTLMARSLSLPLREDLFTKLTSLGDVDEIMDAMSDRIQKAGIDPGRARRALTAHFASNGPPNKT